MQGAPWFDLQDYSFFSFW